MLLEKRFSFRLHKLQSKSATRNFKEEAKSFSALPSKSPRRWLVAKLLGVAVAQLMQNKISVFGHLESPSGYFLNSAM